MRPPPPSHRRDVVDAVGIDIWQSAGYLGMSVETLQRVYGNRHPVHRSEAVENIARFGQPQTETLVQNKN